MPIAYLGLGSNLGDRLATLRAAVAALAELGVPRRCSSVYETAPWGDLDQPPFLNLCCSLDTRLLPEALLAAVKQIERRLGRRATRRWGPREIDVDVLTYGRRRLARPELTVPHPGIAERAFVLAPLAEIAPGLRIPGLAGTPRELLAAIPDAWELVRPVAPPGAVLPASAPPSARGRGAPERGRA